MCPYLVVGLGNPGARYRGTRHNVGFAVVDRLAARWRVVLAAADAVAECAEARVGDAAVTLVKPTTFMNASGAAVAALRRACDPHNVVVVFDDLDLAPGRIRVRGGGGAGGHRGVASVLDAIGAVFIRVRIGIGRPPPGVDAVDFVLAPFTDAEQPVIDAAVARAAAAVEIVVREGLEAAMRAWNGDPPAGTPAA